MSTSTAKRDSIIWPLHEKEERDEGNTGYSNSRVSTPILQHMALESPTSPRLEVSDVIDAGPFSQNFTDLFNSLGLHIPASAEQKQKGQFRRSCSLSYEIEDCDDLKEIDTDWRFDEVEENMVMSPKRAFELSTIQEEPSTLGLPSVELSDFAIEDSEIKHGSHQFSKDTRLCIKRDSGQRYVLRRRRMRKDSSWSEKTILEMLAGLSTHPFIDSVRWSFGHEEYVYLVLDHYPEGSLWDLVAQHGPLGSHRAAFYAAELASAISTLHAAGIVHRDLEPRNIALDSQGHIVLTNFGLAKSVSVSVSGVQHQGMSCPMGFGETMSEYRAPEIFLGWAHDLGVDCWSFGMVLYFMIFGTHPFGGREDNDDPRWLYDRIVVFSVPMESLRLVHPMARDLITKCLERNPSMRWNIEQIKSHGYFELVDWNAVAAKEIYGPSFRRTAMEVDRATFQTQTETQRQRRLSLDNSISYHEHTSQDLSTSKDSEFSSGRRAAKGLRVLNTPLSADFFRPISIATIPIPSAIQEEEEEDEEEEPTSASASTGHGSLERDELSLPLDIDREVPPVEIEPISDFWAEIDREAKASSVAASFMSKEFGRSAHGGFTYTKIPIPKLRKYRSVMSTSHRLFSLSTSSFQKKLRKKQRSAGSLRHGLNQGQTQTQTQTQQQQGEVEVGVERIENLPVGLHQIGSGIGFTYSLPAEQCPSKVSVRSFAPSCQHLFHVPGIHLGLGLGGGGGGGQQPARKAKSSGGGGGASGSGSSPAVSSTRSPKVSVSNPNPNLNPNPSKSREVGHGTFIRDMYRTPSWILSRPDSLPSPLALVNSNSNANANSNANVNNSELESPSVNGSEPLTPATLVDGGGGGVDGEDDHGEVNISIPKSLELDLDLDFRMWRNGSTLRLVSSPHPHPHPTTTTTYPRPVVAQKQKQEESSFSIDMEEESLYTRATSVAGM